LSGSVDFQINFSVFDAKFNQDEKKREGECSRVWKQFLGIGSEEFEG